MENGLLSVGNESFDLCRFNHVYVVGGGKASGAMAQAIEEILGKYLTAGAVNVPYGVHQKTSLIKFHEASHPVPGEAGVKGTLRIIEIAEQAQKDDLIICLISGGGSSLMPLPIEGITICDKQLVTNLLLKSGAPITEVNTVRKHLSAFKGGWLAKKAFPAIVLNLILSDVMGDPLEAIASGPTVPDQTTFSQAIKILEKYNLWSATPQSVQDVLSKGDSGLIEETPKPNDSSFKNVFNVIIGNNRTATLAAVDWLNSMGISTILLSNKLEGEARETGETLAKLAVQVLGCTTRVERPLAVISGGETTVTVTGKGLGGRNQELALSAALHLREKKECVFSAFSTDGVDGHSDAAGAIVDTFTLERAKSKGLSAAEFLKMNDSYHFFSKLGDLIFTEATGTNVNDITIIIG